MKRMASVMALAVAAACASHQAKPPVTVVVNAAFGGDQSDASLLQTFLERAIASRGAPAPRTVRVQYFGTTTSANASEYVVATFAIADANGRMLFRDSLRANRAEGRVEQLQRIAQIIANRVRGSGR